jgi:hypothetical protein
MTKVPRIGRLLDLGGLVLLLGGGATCVRAWIGYESVTRFVPPGDGPAWGAVSVADGYLRLQRIGSGLMLAGVAVFVLAWWVARSTSRRAPTSSTPAA